MKRRNRLRNGRKQVQFGADGAIMAAATLAAAGINAGATASAASQQAAAVESAAKTQADSIKLQTENANKLQQQSLDFNKEQNETNRDLQKDIQMNLQLLTGQQTLNDIKDASKIQVRNGGSMRKRLKSSLRGKNNLPYVVTDGGTTDFKGFSRNGIIMEGNGDTHHDYHKGPGGKFMSGIGLHFINGDSVEMEDKEKLHLIYDNNNNLLDGQFLSAHNIPDKQNNTSFNPSKAVDKGLDPNVAFIIQQDIKRRNGISDDGKHNTKSPVRKLRYAGGVINTPITPDLSLDFLAPVTTGVVAGTRNNMKCGGRLRHKFLRGGSNNFWDNYGGATINAGANLLGAGIYSLGNYFAGRSLSRAYDNAAGILTNAWDKVSGLNISKDELREATRNAHMMPAYVAPTANANAQKAEIERTYNRRLGRINRGIRSSAAAHELANIAEVDRVDMINKAQSEADRINLQIRQQNANATTEASRTNAQLDTEANARFAQAWLDVAKYNNELKNQSILGKAQTLTDAITNKAGVKASNIQAIGNNFAGALGTGANAFGRAHELANKYKTDISLGLMTANPEDKYDWYLNHPEEEGFDSFANKYKDLNPEDENYDKYKDWYKNLIEARDKYLSNENNNKNKLGRKRKLKEHGIQ